MKYLQENMLGAVTNTNQYTLFGHVITYVEKPQDRAGYINKEPDQESNFSDHGERKHDNTTGRFITPVGAKRKSRNLFRNACEKSILKKLLDLE